MAKKKNGTASAENDNNANLDLDLNLLAMAESVVDNEPDYNIDNIPEAEKEMAFVRTQTVWVELFQ